MSKKIIIEFDEEDAEELLDLIRRLLEGEQNEQPRSSATRHRKNAKESSGNSEE
jgi:hypothetical protein